MSTASRPVFKIPLKFMLSLYTKKDGWALNENVSSSPQHHNSLCSSGAEHVKTLFDLFCKQTLNQETGFDLKSVSPREQNESVGVSAS